MFSYLLTIINVRKAESSGGNVFYGAKHLCIIGVDQGKPSAVKRYSAYAAFCLYMFLLKSWEMEKCSTGYYVTTCAK